MAELERTKSNGGLHVFMRTQSLFQKLLLRLKGDHVEEWFRFTNTDGVANQAYEKDTVLTVVVSWNMSFMS
jgi:hypothetical protein